jgi:hypothetical protein
MAKQFLVCIELRGAGPEDYEDLHDSMASRFFEQIVESDGRVQKLPTGTYVSGPSFGGVTSEQALQAARAAASEAAESSGVGWSIVVAATSDDLVLDHLEDADS